ncbi:hypothetical protein BDV19DRAFT_363409 [Aspergillus venezuelensis]
MQQMDLQAASADSSRSSSGRNAPRSRNGCWTCRVKKVKCDEARPQCRRCLRLKLLCDYRPQRKACKAGFRVVTPRGDEARLLSLSTICLPVPPTSSSSVTLTANDHEAIRYFRTTFARLHHTKNPDYSMYSIMFRIAKDCPVVMHMVLAVGGQEMECQRNLRIARERGPGSPLWHYSSALRLMACVIGDQHKEQQKGAFNFDSIYTALWLMLLYEQKNGDKRCAGLVKHLDGAALILDHEFGDTGLLPASFAGGYQQPALSHGSRQVEKQLSLYAARLIMWMVQVDIAAATSGVGGQLHGTIDKLLSTNTSSNGQITSGRPTDWYTSPLQLLDKFEQLHHFSNPLYRTLWGAEYPQSELLHDVENRNVFFFEGACTQLRFMVSQLARAQKKLRGCGDTDSMETERQALDMETAISSVSNRFGDLIDVASSLSIATDNTHKLVANLRRVVPSFYAVDLYFLRVRSYIREKKRLDHMRQRQTEAVRQILNLAYQYHKYDGKEAMARIAWPLFMAGVETEDPVQREWVLGQFSAMGKFGLHFHRAYRFLLYVFELQDRDGGRVDLQDHLQSGDLDLFVIY